MCRDLIQREGVCMRTHSVYTLMLTCAQNTYRRGMGVYENTSNGFLSEV